MPDVFISYSHKDGEYAHHLADALRRHAIDVWIDERIDYGEQWPRVIQDNLTLARIFILIMSTNSFNSVWVQNEVSFAQANNKPIFPLLLEGPVWLSMAAMQYVDVRGGKMPPERFFNELKGDLNMPPAAHPKLSEAIPARRPAPRRSMSLRWLFAVIPILLCIVALAVLLPYLQGRLTPVIADTADITREPEGSPSPTPGPAEGYSADSYGLEIRSMWLGQGMSFDMDTLTPSHDETSDLLIENEGRIVPVNGARITGYGHQDPVDLALCFEIFNAMGESVPSLQTDLYYCFQTNTGSYGYILPLQIDLREGILADVRVFPYAGDLAQNAPALEESSPTRTVADLYGLPWSGLEMTGLWFEVGMCYDMDRLTLTDDSTCDLGMDPEGLLYPLNGAQASGYPADRSLDFAVCQALLDEKQDQNEPVNVPYTPIACFKTNEGRYGFLVGMNIDPQTGTVFDAYTSP